MKGELYSKEILCIIRDKSENYMWGEEEELPNDGELETWDWGYGKGSQSRKVSVPSLGFCVYD